mgnify:CR=1 FL=1
MAAFGLLGEVSAKAGWEFTSSLKLNSSGGSVVGGLSLGKDLGLDLTKSDLRLSKEKSCLGGARSSKSGSSLSR